MSKSVYEMVTDRIINQLEQGVIPWRKPWTGVRSGAFNRISKKPYSLLNQIRLPLFEQFTSANEYYSCAFHESAHSTMKEDRCNRAEDRKGKLVAFGSADYSKEELIAEIGSASLMNIIGIETSNSFKNSAAYIQNWLSVLRNDVKFIVSASSKAEKAVKYIMGEQFTEV